MSPGHQSNAAYTLLGDAAINRHGSRIALHCGVEAVSYRELSARVTRAAAAWRAMGAIPGDRVMILLHDSAEFAEAWLGALHAGAVAIAVNARLSPDDQRYMLEDSDARLFLAGEEFAGAVHTFACERFLGLDTWRSALQDAKPMLHPVERLPTDQAFWLYSSGTTGRPKGIVHTHRDIQPAGAGMRDVLGLGPGDVIFGTSKLFFAYGLEHALLGPLAIGATSVLHPGSTEPGDTARIVARHSPAAFFSVPSFYRRLLGLPPDELAPFGAVRHFVAAGERLPAQILEQWHAATGREILSLYGMSETFCVAMMTPPGTSSALRTGRPLAGIETRLLNDTGAAVEDHEQGVLWIRHPSLTTGYVNRPEATREQFVDGWFCTKDVFLRDDEGFYSHQGREDEFIKVAGQWVQPSELEDAVISNDAIAEAACVRINDMDGFERLALFVATDTEPDAALLAAKTDCEQKLPRHKRPKWVRVVTELPRTATGKVQRFKLREMLERELAGKD
jgi:benzoate-CoA ligase